MTDPDLKWPPTCETCGEPYTKEPTFRAIICSSGFHGCRDCTWEAGRVTQPCCPEHTYDYGD